MKNGKTLLNYSILNNDELSHFTGGKKNSWMDNVSGIAGSASGGAALGAAICGPACGFVGAHYGAIAWVAATGLSGGFGKHHK
ncbi:Blp family class II bacteriocin [Lactobacillus sp. ESL0681]|uniref:Blp family class II bacteriocin n=1 Tax=Lactobacillus sp. ESL0681 TaxID=2983211 RepID=UPI0023F949B0|nr:Blp family class II bacteriocin [Lactobacillus sp. ESL0681]WEV40250.1 Blp family class II bacteriocin [Lactobacillus sp. ESL0681]